MTLAAPRTTANSPPFWRRLGYVPHDDLVAHLAWQEVGDDEESAKPLKFWLKNLS